MTDTHAHLAGPEAELARFVPDHALYRVSALRVGAALAGDWLMIAAAFVVAIAFPHPLVYVLAAIVIARSQLALAVMMHEAAHGLLARNRRANDALGQLFAAGPLWLSLRTYRAGHLKHHRAPMQSDDPVALLFGVRDYPVSRGRLIGRLLAYACGIGYVTSVVKLARGEFAHALPKVAKSRAYAAWEVASMLAGNGALFGALALAGHPLLYVTLWIVPSVTLLPLAGQVRAIFEHAGLPACTDQSRNARTIVRRSWQTFLFGPHAIHFHIEHHLFTRMPFHNLPVVHRQLAQRQLLPGGNLYAGYGAVLRDVSVR
ncbi:TPA: fatty acid desaturase family protein [Burkholderia aenigmatica]|uniref:fatty acid desaturase family protein n=1 Tax=Burkholderia sp. AU45251 TaxID=3059204 RepID=UPI0026525593|nr:fatty acid desaturase family protein [Burkholderia sp. AU45251]HDR9487989.1 fatty acid desaturase family protein [Burkholderia aenigmatica]MDN7521063.1 fatty acid desaturase family protein [Burkholderia sp. AU45251]HDR9519706.1 fatty acid desaturase family protein [Burkholderia aenigmatica]HDR9596736.1 fatty acid desaturase family protein [Burkholderia aenigmatica]HDR9604133.1 fatty acid desaturase family protein [Burkholderia aenigmatica]